MWLFTGSDNMRMAKTNSAMFVKDKTGILRLRELRRARGQFSVFECTGPNMFCAPRHEDLAELLAGSRKRQQIRWFCKSSDLKQRETLDVAKPPTVWRSEA